MRRHDHRDVGDRPEAGDRAGAGAEADQRDRGRVDLEALAQAQAELGRQGVVGVAEGQQRAVERGLAERGRQLVGLEGAAADQQQRAAEAVGHRAQ